jgi:HEAT repeat protein
VRAAAATALSKIDDQESAEHLLTEALGDDDVWVRYFAIRALVAIDRASAVTPLLAHIASSDTAMQVRVAAVEALAQTGPQAFSTLAELAKEADADLSSAALESLGSSNDPRSLQILYDALGSDHVEKKIRAIRALANRHDARTIERLLALAIGREEKTSDEAISALARCSAADAATALIETMRVPAKRDRCLRALVCLGARAVPALVHSLQQGDLDIKRAAVEALTRIPIPDAIASLETALTDSAAAVRFAASSSLSHIRHA